MKALVFLALLVASPVLVMLAYFAALFGDAAIKWLRGQS